MSTATRKVFGTGFMLAMTLAAFATFAQEVTDDDLMPAVDTSPNDTASESRADDRRDAEIDALEPSVTSPVLAPDITRSTTGTQVMDSLELGRTEITGNQELPKVLYIVPWQKSDPGDLMGKPVNSLIDEVLAPIDREEFIRKVDYYNDLYGEDEDE
ncbi:MAG: hypothetical protein KJP16_02435 [Gammaproteobacteria bacterium]|nr:hypothetical protein [Gammaproteobacteria bacterium]NNC56739.1 hypothetical protein [Woeseiaceae bacterium]NNL49648.1 hypothetical protein [Woeseiaceae bacterium]